MGLSALVDTERVRAAGRGGEGGSGVDGRRGVLERVGDENDIRYISMGKQRQHAY